MPGVPESPNFSFLSAHHPALLMHAALAERYVFDDPNTALIKFRQLAEVFARGVAAQLGLPVGQDDSFADIERRLRDAGQLDRQLQQVMRSVRLKGNSAAHSLNGERRDALHSLKLVRQLAIWFHKAVKRDPNFRAGAFVPPPDPANADAELRRDLDDLRLQLAEHQAALAQVRDGQIPDLKEQLANAVREAQVAYENEGAALELAEEAQQAALARFQAYERQLADLATAQATPANEAEREAVAVAAHQAASELDIDEAATRRIIDQQLSDAGWEVDSDELRHGKGTRPIKGSNLAIAEWPTSTGPADYVLFVGLTPIAVVEAKRSIKNVRGSIEQAKRYSRSFAVRGDEKMPGGPWDEYKIPFMFSTNGRAYLKQIASKSGTWFLDGRQPTNHPRPLDGFLSPQGLAERLKQEVEDSNRKLAESPTDYLPLRDYQQNAIRAVEKAIIDGRRELLIAMATGTGKTRTSIAMIYRLVKANRFRRVLFLVDRSALGEQAADAFKDVKLENFQSFNEIYDIKELGDIVPDQDTRLHIATIQGMVNRVLNADDESGPPPVDTYDLIVVDECHRGYNLDQEMSEGELSFRSEADYISKYMRVLDHFDAVKIGLTATPALHTTDLFGGPDREPVFEYSYRQAVVDGYLVDHEPPFQLITALAEDKMRWERGEVMKVYHTRSDQLELSNVQDEVEVAIDQFNRKVITENFNKAVCGALADHIDPDLPGKTLVFCVTDAHADMVVDLLTQAFEDRYGAIVENTVLKVTGNSDKPSELIRRYKNEQLPKVAVTVDLLTTGIDVPEITNIVFIRRIRSRILYEQMLGRATRLCEDLLGDSEDKDRFYIFDAVDLYSALEPHTNMKPVVTRPNIPFRQLADELASVENEEYREDIKDQIVAKLQRKKKGLKGGRLEQFETLVGLSPKEFVDQLTRQTPSELSDWFAANADVVEFFDRVFSGPATLIVSEHEDEIRRIERGYGTATRPEDYLESFRNYVRENVDQIEALKIVCQRPRDLTRQQLKELKLLLDQQHFSETNLRTAYRESTNQDIAATIIGYIRHVALGDPLVPYEERVKTAMTKILTSRTWTAPQRKWLERIGKQLEQETVVDPATLERGRFKEYGGFARLNKIFDGQLEAILHDIAGELWEVAA